MMCSIHNHEMDYVPSTDEVPEHWHCEECQWEEEHACGEEFEYEREPSHCAYCVSEMFDGYCVFSPDGQHHHADD
jgi:hypothetical protein